MQKSLVDTIIELAKKHDKFLEVSRDSIKKELQCSSSEVDAYLENLSSTHVYIDFRLVLKDYSIFYRFVHKSLFEQPYFITWNILNAD